nr:DNA polymerase delta catalytic subunit [Ipomoea batatas]GMC88561.1 DNA polymerase delta catalytic subunit [Ipomoea batatas]
MSSGNPRKRPQSAPAPSPQLQKKQQAAVEEEDVDEDIFLEETLLQYDEDSQVLRELEEQSALAERLRKWKRPQLSQAYLSQSQSVVFQQLEIDYVIGESHKELLPNSSGPAAIIRIFGVTKEGHSVCCHVHGFEPYFYISCPAGMGPDDISRFHQILEDRMREANRNNRVPKFVRRIEIVQKRSIMYYQQQGSQPFLKIVVALPTMVTTCRGILDRGIQIDGLGMKSFMTYESNVLFALRFMIDCGVVGGNWIEVPAGKYKKSSKNISYSQLEFDCLYSDLISHKPEGEFSKMAPFRILSFDIECAGRKGHFPEPTHDPVIQGQDQPFVRNVMTLKSCSPIVGVDVMSFETEREVLLAWRRAEALGMVEFPILGRVRNSRKEDVHHSIISDLQNGNSETRRRLAVYCLKDAYLPQRLLDKLMFIYNYVEMARVTGIPISFLLSRGQSIKVLSQLLRKAKEKNLVIPNVKQAGSEQGTYEGATVLEPRAGFYEKPIATLDFASLYPSIMMAYNLCYCTLVTPDDVRKLNLPPECVHKTPSGETFVKSNLQKGILPEILEELLAARKRAKADLKEAKDPLEKAVLDGRQLALKISANSVYGFTGATVGQLPCLEISSSVTSYGRQMIEHTKKLVEDKFKVLGGYQHNAEPIRLEFEKVYYPYLLISKKRYAGLLWTNPDKFDKMDAKGIETVRRDNCLLVKNLVTECLHKILIDRDVPGAVQYVKNTISDLLMNRMDLSLLVITKGLTKTGDDYEVKAAHVELAERMRKRDPATAPNMGDRVPYVIVKAAKGAKAYEKSEDPIYVLENNIPIDPQYYLENQISKPLLRIFEPILKNASKELLHGSHTRSISISTPSTGGIMKFAKKQLTCIGCKALISRDCPIFYRRKKAQKDMAEAKIQLDRWSF